MKHHATQLTKPAAPTRHPWLGAASNAIRGVLTASLTLLRHVFHYKIAEKPSSVFYSILTEHNPHPEVSKWFMIE